MSSTETPAAAVCEPTPDAPSAVDSAAVAEVITGASAEEPTQTPTPSAPIDAPITADSATPVVQPTVANEVSNDANGVEPPKPEDERKEKKQGRKPFVDLFNKILKPHPHDKATSDKKPEAEATSPVIGEAALEPTSPAPIAPVETSEPVVNSEVPADTPHVDDASKDAATPRKERGTIFEKLTALVMKPKSPKLRKQDNVKEESEDPKVEGNAADASPQSPVEEAAPTASSDPAPVASSDAPAAEAPEESKAERKEKTPKDLAKLARRFSGRLFGVEKKKDASKKPEPTHEEPEATPNSEHPAEPASDSAPQLPTETPSADTTPEAPQSGADSAPVIAAAA